MKPTEKPGTPTLGPEDRERADKFDKIDKEKLGKVTRAAFIESQSDSETAAKRFEKDDADKDGLLNRQEFIGSGR